MGLEIFLCMAMVGPGAEDQFMGPGCKDAALRPACPGSCTHLPLQGLTVAPV